LFNATAPFFSYLVTDKIRQSQDTTRQQQDNNKAEWSVILVYINNTRQDNCETKIGKTKTSLGTDGTDNTIQDKTFHIWSGHKVQKTLVSLLSCSAMPNGRERLDRSMSLVVAVVLFVVSYLVLPICLPSLV
jgi:hypothetical protein